MKIFINKKGTFVLNVNLIFIAGEKMKQYADYLNEEIHNFDGTFEKYIFYAPDFFKLLCDLLDSKEINKDDKKRINSAIAYFVVPRDFIPEELYGPAGYIDDIFICVVVIKYIKSKYGENMIKSKWVGEEPIIDVINHCYSKTKEELEKHKLVDKLLKSILLDDIYE
jgi:uncharacterized membrane protein YkvA (DUF1232 family)